MKYLVVGAGFAGAVYARELADAGHEVTVIDQRDHIAGNCYDYRTADGVLIHRYGPHIFHTSNERVVEWLSRFTQWIPYEHRVRALLEDGRQVPLPVNLDTIEAVFGVELGDAEAASAFLADKAVPCAQPGNAAQYLYSKVGQTITDLFFRRYNRKMWNLDLEALSEKVVQRVPIRFDREDRYFPGDSFQAMPRDGYTAIFERILDHPAITVRLATAFDKAMEAGFDHTFNAMPIDVYFDYQFGELPYRSIRFHHFTARPEDFGGGVTVNFTDTTPYTRMTCWANLPGQPAGAPLHATREEPCDYHDNHFERYYPVKTAGQENEQIYRAYAELAAGHPTMIFIGRCGTYQYLDMHQVINQSLAGVQHFLAGKGAKAP